MPLILPPDEEVRVLKARSMLRFHWALLIYGVVLSRSRMGATLTLLGGVALFVAVVDREFARDITNWNGFSPLWGVGLVLLWLVWGYCKASWDSFRYVCEKRDELRRENAAMRAG